MGSRRFASLLLVFRVFLVALVSCLQGAKAPHVTASRTLDLAASEGGDGGSKRPFAVVFSGPHGKTSDPSEVTIVFNRPMRPLELAGEESAPPARIAARGTTQAPKGSWRWLGTSALIFAPEPALPRATEYEVTVPAETKALDGSVLGTAFSFTFATQTPALARIEPREGERHLKPRATFDLRFTQPVDPREVERAAKVHVGDAKTGRNVAFKASWPKGDTKTLVRITPSQALPLASAVAITLDKSLHGMEGPLPTGEDRRVDLATYGPLEARGIECSKSTPHGRCAAHGYLSFSLTNAVPRAELRAHVKVEGAPLRWDGSSDGATAYVGLNAKLAPAKSYAVVVTAGIKDVYGQALARDVRIPFDTDDEWPSLEVGVAGSVFEAAARPREVPIAAMNLASYELVTASLDEAALVEATAEPPPRWDALKRMRGAKLESVQSAGAANTNVVKMVRLDAMLTKGRGAALVAVRHEPRGTARVDARVLAVTDLAISAKMSRFGSLVWVTHLSDGAPAAGANVSVRNGAGEVFATRADSNGIALIPADKYVPVDQDGREDRVALLIARSGDDWTWRPVRDSLSAWMYSLSSDPAGRLTPMGMLFTDRGIYKAGETIRAKGLFRVPLPRGTATPKGRDVTLQAFDSNGTKIFEQRAMLGAFGEVAADVPIPASARLGSVELRAELPSSGGSGREDGSATAVVELAAYRPAEIKVGVETDKPSYVRGEKAAFTVRGDYLFGAPMTAGKVRFTATRGSGYFVPPNSDGFVLDDGAYAWALPDSSPRAGEFQSG